MEEQTKIGIIDTLNQAWQSIRGSKAAIWLVAIIMIIIGGLLNLLVYRLFQIDFENPPYWIRYIGIPIITNLIIAPFYAGALMCAIRHIRGEKISPRCGFQYFNYYFSVAIAMTIVAFIASLGVLIVNLPTVSRVLGHSRGWFDILAALFSTFVYTFFLLTIPLITDKNQQPVEAMQQSIQIIKPHWLRVFAILIITYVIVLLFTTPMMLGEIFSNTILLMIGIALLVIALIWIIPWVFLIQATIYHRLVNNYSFR